MLKRLYVSSAQSVGAGLEVVVYMNSGYCDWVILCVRVFDILYYSNWT